MAAEDRELAARGARFTIDLTAAASERAEAHDWGTAILNPSIPQAWDANHLHLTDPAMEAEDIVALADEIIGGTGMEHRSVLHFDDEAGQRLAPEMERLGWVAERNVGMVLEGDPRPGKRAIEVQRERLADIEDLRRGEDPPDPSREVLEEHLLEWTRRTNAVGGDDWFTARGPGGERASSCQLFGRDGIGQIEDVATLESQENRGLGTAVTVAAAQASRARGDEITFLSALADDWPRRIYERIGFRPYGIAWGFRRMP